MSDQQQNQALRILRDLESRIRRHALDLPSDMEIKEEWSGIGFRLGKTKLVSRLGEVVEILTYPGFSKVPGAKDWVRGVANIRGNLLPILDLRGFLLGRSSVPSRQSRVLVIQHGDVYSGLIVDEVLGMKHFQAEERISKAPCDEAALTPYLDSGFELGDEAWSVFNMERLAETPHFLQAAV